MDYKETIRYLASIEKLGIKLALRNISQVLEAMGRPQEKFRSILVSGTNGKGSVGSMLASILNETGARAGLYTSPHLVRHEERIAVGGRPITPDDFSRALTRTRETIDRLLACNELTAHPTHFETLTAAAFDHFAQAGVEIAVLEVGMGGRLDATVLARPELSIITNISLEHTAFLGDTIAAIAREKSGILPEGGTLLTASTDPEAIDVFREAAAARKARLVLLDDYAGGTPAGEERRTARGPESEASSGARDQEPATIARDKERTAPDEARSEIAPLDSKKTGHDSPEVLRPASSNQTSGASPAAVELHVRTRRRQHTGIPVTLPGGYQRRNTLLAVAAADLLDEIGFPVPLEAVTRGIRNTRWPGRFQIVEGSPRMILDGAHNPAGCAALAAALKAHGCPPESTTLIFGAHRTKDYMRMLEAILPTSRTVILTRGSSPKFRDPHAYASEARELTRSPVTPTRTLQEAIDQARRATPPNGTILITGSLYLVGDTMIHQGIDPFPEQAQPKAV